MKVLVLSNGEFTTKEITNKLEDLQEIVGGYIEIPFLSKTFSNNGIDVIINEEGKFIDSCKPQIAIVDEKTKQVLDVVHGNCIFASHDAEGNTIELNEKQTKIVMRELQMEVVLSYKDTGKEFMTKLLFV